MATAKTTRNRNTRKNHAKYPIGVSSVEVHGIREVGDDEDRAVSHRVSIAGEDNFSIQMTWEYDANRNNTVLGSGNEFFHATFTSDQLFELAAKTGLLITTESSERPVPKGVAAAMRLTTKGAA